MRVKGDDRGSFVGKLSLVTIQYKSRNLYVIVVRLRARKRTKTKTRIIGQELQAVSLVYREREYCTQASGNSSNNQKVYRI